jgi:hypothetical protein
MQELNEEQRRIAANLEQVYDVWREAIIARAQMPRYMLWKTVNGTNYLYVANPIEKSKGRESNDTRKTYEEFSSLRDAFEARIAGARDKLKSLAAQYRAIRLPMVMALPAKILQEMDLRGVLSSHFLVVGSLSMPAYEIEAGARLFAGLDETEDFDLSWTGRLSLSSHGNEENDSLLRIAKAVDTSFEVSPFSPQKIVNKKAFEIDVLCSRGDHFKVNVGDKRRIFGGRVVPVELEGQDILHLGHSIRHIILGRDGVVAPLCVPDPRFMAIHKQWLSKREDRSSLKRGKDHKQASILWDVCKNGLMFGHPINDDFLRAIPDEWRISTAELDSGAN